MKIKSRSGKPVPYDINTVNNWITVSSKSGIQVIDINLQAKKKITGFIAQGLVSFQLFTKRRAKNSRFVPYRSDVTDEILTFTVSDGKVFLPDYKTLTVQRLQLREIKLNPGTDVNVDILGCCLDCPPLTTVLPSPSPTPTLPPSKWTHL